MERALLVTVRLEKEAGGWNMEDSALELEELVVASGAEAVDNIPCARDKPTPNLYIGKGKALELAGVCTEEEIDTVIFSRDLSGTQQRNLEEVIGKKTIDRTQLILDIFAQRARTPEGKMQVELAQLQYLLPRLVGKGIILSRLGGGIGTRGPGEQKLEVDRRVIRKRIDKLKAELLRVRMHRRQLRKNRAQNCVACAALVGYTNAGKSTLLNALTAAGQAVSDGLFTTLDPLSKGLRLPNGENAVISDTVGFLHQLPHHLVESFKATLEEVAQADLLILVLDASNPLFREHYKSVEEVLAQLGAQHKPRITVLNKVDLLADELLVREMQREFFGSVAISAQSGKGIDSLLERLAQHFSAGMAEGEFLIPYRRADLVGLCYRQGKVRAVQYLQEGIKVKAHLPKALILKLKSQIC
jgi:GTP-binding protein HflX